MIEVLKMNVLYPALGRLGTGLTLFLIGQGVTQQHADWVAIGLTGVGGAVFDFSASWIRQRLIVNRTLATTLKGLFP